MKKEKLLGSQQIYQGRILKLRLDTVEKHSGEKTTREIVEHDDCIVIVALDKDDNVLLVRQFRQGPAKELLEVPAGGINTGEDAEQAACRELQEETGYFPQKLSKLGGFYSAPGYCTEYMHLYLATDLVYDPRQAEDTEDIELTRVTLADIPELITSGNICDAKSIAGLLSIYLHRQPGS